MRAIVLAGGEGTRMRPLTRRTPKPLVPLLNRPLLEHLLLHLRDHGFDQVTLALTHRAEAIQQAFGRGERLGLVLEYAYENPPRGSGGAIAMVADGWTETFLVCNGDIITDLNLSAMLAAHRSQGAELSISLYEVDDPSPFGVADIDETRRIRGFVEKPSRELAPSRFVNSGSWLFEPLLLAGMDASRFNRVEYELFPRLCKQGRPVYGYRHEGYWADVGNPAALLRVNLDLVGGAVPARLPALPPMEGVLLGDGTVIALGAHVEGPVVIGARSHIGAGATVAGSVLWEDVTIGAGAIVHGSTIASSVVIGAGAVVLDSVIAHDTTVESGARLSGVAVEPATVIAAGMTP
ncbi:MAG: NDP-sugar synthase [Dehalococcoidia bacterium]|nr:NDP-sugar synthase [Dehalococcoidia bacterium]